MELEITTLEDEATPNFSNNSGVYASIHAPPISTAISNSNFQYPGLLRALLVSDTHPVDPMMISQFYLSRNITPSYPDASLEHYTHYSSTQLPASSNLLPLQNFGFSGSILFNHQNNNETPISGFNAPPPTLWNLPDELEDISVESFLEMGLHTNAYIRPNNFLMGSSSLFPNNVGSNDFMIGPSATFSDNLTTP
ncbi:hypothetical protein LIER_43942 [Lithospermum erythrorhizon]|uniref:Uncharacterized protein n=1 Tax=Lithospermum erythrorhizon TaxID=34254 RepID=A0AAV3RDE2_LITER